MHGAWPVLWRQVFRFFLRLLRIGKSEVVLESKAPQNVTGLYRDPDRGVPGATEQLTALNPKERLRVLEYFHEYMQRTVRRMTVEDRTSLVEGHLWNEVVAFQEQENFERAMERFRLEQAEQIDKLTGLLKRDPFVDRYNRLIEAYASRPNPEKFVALVALDLDYFRKLNEQLGHQQADEVLRAVGTVFRQLRLGDEACRIGGDEFMFLLTNTPQEEIDHALQRIHNLLCTMKLPVKVAEAAVNAGLTEISVSFGAVAFRQTEVMHFAAAREEADKASYEMKQRGRNGYVIVVRDGKYRNFAISQRGTVAYRELFSGEKLPEPTFIDRRREVRDAMQRVLEEIELHGDPEFVRLTRQYANQIGDLLHESRIMQKSDLNGI